MADCRRADVNKTGTSRARQCHNMLNKRTGHAVPPHHHYGGDVFNLKAALNRNDHAYRIRGLRLSDDENLGLGQLRRRIGQHHIQRGVGIEQQIPMRAR